MEYKKIPWNSMDTSPVQVVGSVRNPTKVIREFAFKLTLGGQQTGKLVGWDGDIWSKG